MADRFYIRPAAPLLVAMMAGIFLGTWLPGYSAAGWTIGCGAAIFLGWCILNKRSAFFIPLFFFLAIGYLSIQPWSAPDFASDHIVHYTHTQKYNLTGLIITDIRRFSKRSKFVLQAESILEDQKWKAVQGKVAVTIWGNDRRLKRGDRIRLVSRLRRPRNFYNPGSFKYERYMAHKGIWATAFVPLKRVKKIDFTRAEDSAAGIWSYRARVAQKITGTVPMPAQAILKALLIGEKKDITPEWRQTFNRLGIGHLLAISGLYMGIVAMMVFWAARWVMVRIGPLLWRGWCGRGASLAAAAAVVLYGLISGLSPSAQRAMIMVVFFLASTWIGRDTDSANTLIIAAFLILIVHPPALYAISFQFSFAAVGIILIGLKSSNMPPEKNIIRRVRKRLIQFFQISMLALLGSLPLVMYYFNQVSWIGPLSNFIFIPLIGMAVVPLGLLAVFLLPFDALSTFFFKTAGALLSGTLSAADTLSSFPFLTFMTVTPSILEIICYYLLLIFSLAMWRIRSAEAGASFLRDPAKHEEPHPLLEKNGIAFATWLRSRSALFALASIVLVVMAGDGLYWGYQRFWHRDLRVSIVDVGQGGATLVEFPGGATMLIDGGGFGDNSVFDVGQRILAPLLLKKKIRSVNTLVLSHPDSDHLNGLIYLAEHFNVDNVWTNGQTVDTAACRHFMEVLKRKRITPPAFRSMPRMRSISGVKFEIMNPPADYESLRLTDKWRDRNNNGLVVKLSLGRHSFLFTADVERSAEKEMTLRSGTALKSTVLIAPHHGSISSSTPAFLAAVKPEVVIISAGYDNRYHFPHPRILKRYRDRGCRIYNTAQCGLVDVATNGKKMYIRSTRSHFMQNSRKT